MVVLHHNHNHINLIEELVKVQNLILDNLLLSEEGIEGLQRTGEVALLDRVSQQFATLRLSVMPFSSIIS